MIYFYFGDDSFSARETVLALRKKFIQTYDRSGHNVERIDENEFTLERFFTAVKASGFLAPKKFIVIKNIFSVKKFSEIQEPLIDYLKEQKNTTDENYLVFWHEGLPKKNLKLFKMLIALCAERHCCKEFQPLSDAQLVQWIERRAHLFGKKIDRDAARLVASLVGNNLWYLHHELQKLCHVTSKDTITVEVVPDLIRASRGIDIFSLVDAISGRTTASALSLLEQYLRTETDRQFLLSMLIRQYRLILLAKDVSREARNSYVVAERLKLHPFVAKKMLQHSSYYTKKELERIYGNLLALDMILKSDPEKMEVALTLFVSRLSPTSVQSTA